MKSFKAFILKSLRSFSTFFSSSSSSRFLGCPRAGRSLPSCCFCKTESLAILVYKYMNYNFILTSTLQSSNSQIFSRRFIARGVYYYQWGDFFPTPTNSVESLSSPVTLFWSGLKICPLKIDPRWRDVVSTYIGLPAMVTTKYNESPVLAGQPNTFQSYYY